MAIIDLRFSRTGDPNIFVVTVERGEESAPVTFKWNKRTGKEGLIGQYREALKMLEPDKEMQALRDTCLSYLSEE